MEITIDMTSCTCPTCDRDNMLTNEEYESGKQCIICSKEQEMDELQSCLISSSTLVSLYGS